MDKVLEIGFVWETGILLNFSLLHKICMDRSIGKILWIEMACGPIYSGELMGIHRLNGHFN